MRLVMVEKNPSGRLPLGSEIIKRVQCLFRRDRKQLGRDRKTANRKLDGAATLEENQVIRAAGRKM